MHPFDNGIGFEKDPPIRQAQVQHGAVVAGAGNHRFIGRQGTGQPLDQFKFVHGTDRRLQGELRMKIEKFTALKIACVMIGARSVSLRS